MRTVDSDAKCNPVDSIGSSTESRVSHSEPRLLLGFKKGQRRLGEKEHRARSVTPGVALRVGIQGARIKVSSDFARNPLKMLISDERIQGNPSFSTPAREGQNASDAAWPRKSKSGAYRRPN